MSTYHGLPVHNLKDVLSGLDIPDKEKLLSGLSGKWRCVLCPRVAESASTGDLGGTEGDILPYLHRGLPVFTGAARAQSAYDAAGKDALAFAQRESWNRFPKPQIAVTAAWGAPGTTLESADYHKLIGSVAEVFRHQPPARVLELTEEERQKVADAEAAGEAQPQEEEEPDAVNRLSDDGSDDGELLELQIFHRQDPSASPALPALGEQLLWPSFVADGAECDVGTNISQRGCLRHWRLNDSGEFAFYAALPQAPPTAEVEAEAADTEFARRFLQPAEARGLPCGKCFIFGPHDSYDWFIHDDEALMRNKLVLLDLFHTPDEALPVDATQLPVLAVAVLQSGGAPLLVPPNLPYVTLAVADCVVVEQRRIAHLWLDEVSYFLHHCSKWATNPIVYDYLERDLQDDAYVAGQLIPLLIELFQSHGMGSTRAEVSDIVRERAVRSLYSIAVNAKHYGLSESSRPSLVNHLNVTDEMRAVLQRSGHYGADCSRAAVSLEEYLQRYWSLKQYWPKPGCVLRIPRLVPIRLLSPAAAAEEAWYLPVVYAQCRPFYGTERNSVEGTVAEYFCMKELENKRRGLLTLLKTRKTERDDILDELF